VRPKFIGSFMFPTVIVLLLALFAVRDTASVLAHAGPDLTPALVEVSLPPGGSTAPPIVKTVHTPAIPPRPDICFLADTTGSMFGALANVEANATSIMNAVRAAQPDSQFCAAQYRDAGDTPEFALDEPITATIADVQAAITAWAAGGGGDDPESQLHALTVLAGAATGWRAAPATHIIVWFGDNPGHDPSIGGETLASTISTLTTTGVGAPIRVVAVPVDTGGLGLDSTGQATAITAATGGVLLPSASPDQVAAAILTGLSNLPVTVAMATNCSGDVTATFAPPSQVVTSGVHAVFDETITLSATAPQGTTLTCEDWATLDGTPMMDATGAIILERKTIHVLDVTPPMARCLETTNPSGKNVPTAGGNPKSGQNPDGFYELVATDNVDPDPEIFVVDKGTDGIFGTADDTLFGAFSSGTKIKYTEANGAPPSQKPGAGDIDWMIHGRGDFGVYAVDASGNVGDHVQCHVPPPPK